MALKQSTLHFKQSTATLDSTAAMSVARPKVSRSSTASSAALPSEDDTIVVDTSLKSQLPTPDDSTTDVSSQSSQMLQIKKVPQGQAKRVPRVNNRAHSEDCLVETVKEPEGGSRNVSGKTLVSSGSQSSMLRNGIDALNIQWALSQANLSLEDDQESFLDSLDTINVVTEPTPADPAQLVRKASSKELKANTEKKRQAKYKAAEEKATRRSSRVPLMERASSMVSDLAASASTLGKRSHGVMERSKDRLGSLKRTGSLRPRSMIIENTTSVPSFEGPTTKKRRMSVSVLERSASDSSNFTVPRKPLPTDTQVAATRPPRSKKWLASGLYAGQPRTFSASMTGSANRRKSAAVAVAATEPVKENSVLPLPMFAGERLWNIGKDFKLPFDVFSPLPPGQPKPDEWRKMNKNTFVGDAAAYWRGNDGLLKQFRSLCGCSEASGCDDDCQNRIMFYECNENNCSLGPKHCGNRSFADLRDRVKKGGKFQVGVEVIKTMDRGNGVRSNRTFDPNQIIVEYSGEIITQEECETRMHNEYKDNSSYYLMLFDSALIIDATVRGSIARFVNHSCDPNCRMEKWTVNGQPRMALFANERGIMTGEELTYDYNFDPFCARNVQECRCGSIGCRGILGKRAPGEKKAANAKEEKKTTTSSGKVGVLAGAKRKLQAVLDESTSALNLTKKNKKQKLMDAPTAGLKTKPKTSNSMKGKKVPSSTKRAVSFTTTTGGSPGKMVKPRNSPGPNNTPASSRAVSYSSTAKKSTTFRTTSPAGKVLKKTPSTASKKIKSRIQTPGAGLKSVSSGQISSSTSKLTTTLSKNGSVKSKVGSLVGRMRGVVATAPSSA